MKRYVVGTLLFSIVMFVQLFGNIPVFADTFVPTSSYDFTALADLGYALVGGAEFDFDGTPYVIDNYNSLSAEQKEIQKSLAAREFLKDYMESRGIAFEENGELQKGSAYYTIAFGLAGQEFFEAFQTAAASDQEDLEYNMPISPSRFADWAQYNKYWFNRYANAFEAEPEVIIGNIPSGYEWVSSIGTHTIGSSSTWNLDSSDFYTGSTYITKPSLYTIVLPSNTNKLFTSNDWASGNFLYPAVYGPGSVKLDNVSGSSQYTLSIDGFVSQNILNGYNNAYSMFYNPNFSPTRCQFYSLQNSSFPSTTIYFANLDIALSYVNGHFRGCGLVVDGDIWITRGDEAPANPAIPDFPDIINQETGELAYDITMPKTQDYSGSFDLTSLFDAIREGIAGASDGDIATGSTIGSLDVGRTYTGEGIDIQDRVIDLTSSRVFDGTLTDDTTGRLPKPPVVPPAVSAGLGGVTVLAKYVDATQCILPEDLMTAFWGCVWILIMLGLIKNLHR